LRQPPRLRGILSPAWQTGEPRLPYKLEWLGPWQTTLRLPP
jgi:hypothetical protein